MTTFKHIISILLLMPPILSQAQNDSLEPIKVRCKVVDQNTKKPLEYVLVELVSKTVVQKKYTDSSGTCYFDSLSSEIYFISAKLTGYTKTSITDILLIKSKILRVILNNDLHTKGCSFSISVINKTEPTHDQFNSRQIMRMPY
jgi:hypothetical protein